MPNTELPMNLEDQVVLMKKYVNFRQRKKMRDFLGYSGYFRASRYGKYLLTQVNVFGSKADSKVFFELYEFDVKLRLLLFKYCKKAEVYFKSAVANAVTLQTKIKLLQDAVELYKGDIYSSASGEHWLMPHEISYRYKCLGFCNELMKLFFESQNYTSVQHYAHRALELDEANPDAYYWKIRALKKKDSMGMVKGELLMAEHVLGPDLYEELIKKLERTKDCD